METSHLRITRPRHRNRAKSLVDRFSCHRNRRKPLADDVRRLREYLRAISECRACRIEMDRVGLPMAAGAWEMTPKHFRAPLRHLKRTGTSSGNDTPSFPKNPRPIPKAREAIPEAAGAFRMNRPAISRTDPSISERPGAIRETSEDTRQLVRRYAGDSLPFPAQNTDHRQES